MTEVSGAARRASHPRGFALCAQVRVSAREWNTGLPVPSRVPHGTRRTLRGKVAYRRRPVTLTVAVMSTGWSPQNSRYMPGTFSFLR